MCIHMYVHESIPEKVQLPHLYNRKLGAFVMNPLKCRHRYIVTNT